MVNPSLPQELIEEIVVRLPVSSLSRFKCVCKSWLSLISDSKFAELHYDLAAEPTYRYLLKSTHGSQVRSIDIQASSLDDYSSVLSHVLPHSFSPRRRFDDYDDICIYGSCRGFLLLDYTYGDLLVWSPTTGARKPISYSHFGLLYNFLFGFGYDASTDDYLVLLIEMSGPKKYIAIFSLKTNSWDQIECCKLPYQNSPAVAGLLFNGALHWLVFSMDTFEYVIIAFDLIERSLFEIPLPDGTDLKSDMRYKDFHLRLVGDSLCLCYPGSCDHAMAEIWMMKEYKVQSSWTKSFVLPTCDILHSFFLPICFTKFEGLFGSNSSGRLVKFNSKGVLIELGTCDFDFLTDCLLPPAVFRESLLSLPGDVGELSEDGKQSVLLISEGGSTWQKAKIPPYTTAKWGVIGPRRKAKKLP